MTLLQMFVAFACFLLATQQIAAVVNNSKGANLEETTTTKGISSTSAKVPDAVASETEQDVKRREAPADIYGLPLTDVGIDSYVPTGPSNPALPIPVYGVPDALTTHIIYPSPPPDVPPPLPQISTNYGPPLKTYGLPQNVNGLGLIDGIVAPPPPAKYLPPIKPHKPFTGKPLRPRPQYGPPHKPIFVPKLPKPTYGPPRPVYGPPKTPLFVPQKNNFKQQSVTILSIPSSDLGVSNLGGFGISGSGGGHGTPNLSGPPLGHYGLPDPVPLGPPHPGVPAPPTPPDIKYDGWQPIPGLISRPPSDSYGLPEGEHHGNGDLQNNVDFTPPPSNKGQISTSAGVGYASPQRGISDSYGAPLNSVTGSGAIVSSSGDSHYDEQSLSVGLSAAGIKGPSQLSVIKSIGYELFPNTGSLSHIGDSYSAPPLSSYSPNGPYAAAHSYKTHELSSGLSFNFPIKSQHSSSSHGYSLSSNIGLIPPSGVYGAPPNGLHGTPLLIKPSQQYGPPLNALKINPPKHPVIFREPVPAGLIESVGQHTAHKDAHGIIEGANYLQGPTYIPPPIPDITKPVKEAEPPAPSHLYSLPSTGSPVSFHGGSSSDIFSLGLNSNILDVGGPSQLLTSYTAPLGSIDGSYALPLHSGPGYSVSLDNAHPGGVTVGIDNSLPPISIDLTSSTTNNVATSTAPLYSGSIYQNGYDCSSHKSQPLPSLSYGVPSATSYTASLSSLTANIGGLQQTALPSGSYGLPDLQSEHSQKVKTAVPANSIDDATQEKNYGKALLGNFGSDAKLVKSESIDIDNIPVKGSLGAYTLQIQPAEDLRGTGGPEQISHAQVLNGGLLQSILAAIEQPHREDATILGRPLSQLRPGQSRGRPADADGQQSAVSAVVVPTEAPATTPEPVAETDASLRLIDNNEIALYFSNKVEDKNKDNSQSSVLNGQQYGSYVSFRTPNASYVYGNLKSDKEEKTKEED